ncbi:MAG: TerC family protein [Sediminibacterium sp.]|nr:TerC family protein [Sediminibacterium sp.]
MEYFFSFLTLVFLEIILGIDNIIFIAIIVQKGPKATEAKLRFWGLTLAMIIRLVLLAGVSWLLKLNDPIFNMFYHAFSLKDLILFCGGLFLVFKSTKEIYHITESNQNGLEKKTQKNQSFSQILLSIIILDVVFSIDSIITAVGMAKEIYIMYAAVICSMIVMIFSSKIISDFILKHPSFKILALSFLMMIGTALIAEGFHVEFPKGFIYSSLLFAFLVDILQMKALKGKK